MPEKSYRVFLDEENSIFVYFETTDGVVTSFVVKYLSIINQIEYEILRYDSGHDVAHVDYLNSNGEVEKKIWLSHLNFAQAFTHARRDIEENYLIYRERFIQWQNNDLQKKIKK